MFDVFPKFLHNCISSVQEHDYAALAKSKERTVVASNIALLHP
jgi:hypothetical protein